jgi:hypothetical protein
MIKLISHHYCPEDQYTKEIAILELPLKDGSAMRFVYVRKEIKSGGMFWGPLNCSVMIDGQKQHFKSPMFDSNFLEQDIKEFLNSRQWEKATPKIAQMDSTFAPSHAVTQSSQPDFFDIGEPPF